MMDYQAHTIHEVKRLVDKAHKELGVTADEMYIALARITNVRESEQKRIAILEEEHEKTKLKYRSTNAGELPDIPQNDE
jgi:hypothetical protein